MNVEQLLEQRAALWTQMTELLDTASRESRDLSAEEAERYDRLEADLDAKTSAIERAQRHAAHDAALSETRAETRILPRGDEARDVPVSPIATPEYREAFMDYLRFGAAEMEAEQRAVLRHGFRRDEERAAQTVTTSGGGYLIPTQFQNELIRAMQAYGGVRANARVITTDSGSTLNIPTLDDTSNKGRLLGINTTITNTAIALGQKTLDAYKYSSDSVLVPFELMQDSAFDMDGLIRDILAERLGRITEEDYTTGTGSSQPNGVVTAATLGKTGASGQTTTVIADDLVDLWHSVDPAYRLPSAVWMMNDSTVKAVRKLKTGVSGDDTYLWQPGLAAREPDTLLGNQVVVNQQVAAMAASAKSILFGNFQRYWIRDTGGIRVVRMNERYADDDQVGFVAFMRTDGELIGPAGTIRYYANAAS